MRFESRTWFLLSLLLFAAAAYFWKRGNEYQIQKNRSLPPIRQNATTPPAASKATSSAPFQLLTRLAPSQATATAAPTAPTVTAASVASTPNASTPGAGRNLAFPHRLSNSDKSVAQLTHSDSAVLMRNAMIDTAEKASLRIPEHLRADGDPGSYIVQARGPIQKSFRAQLQAAGASIVSYIPNNAYLVESSAAGAQRLAVLPETQAVLPYEPYFKLDTKLLGLAVDQKPLLPDEWLRITAFPDSGEAAVQALTNLGAEVLGQEQTPFGPQLLVKPMLESLPAIAKLASVQTIELFHARQFLTDQTRVIIGLSDTGSNPTNYLNLTGSNILVNLNDTGVDATHPDLVGRVFGDTALLLKDPSGHGTHVAGILAGSGAQSSSVAQVPGSATNANLRGMAPGAQLFVLPLSFDPEPTLRLQDTYLQETAARTNLTISRRKSGPMISNNSWSYVGANEYDSASALYDAAVRDALRQTNGSQAMIYVFAAGDSGGGTDEGTLGEANSIASPSNAKNVITVGATENMRFLTNAVLTTNVDGSITTNAPFLGMTDNSGEVAAFSSRGNVGIGTEGEFGRFKPDVVAPGTFMVAARSKDWKLENDFDTNTVQFGILQELNQALAPYYQFESGTSQSAPVVSGMLALMQEFFEQRLPAGLRRTNSPALMKALLINGSRSLGPQYNLQVQNAKNYQGWGLVNVSNSLPQLMMTQPEAAWPIRLIDQNPTNALATGQSKSWNIGLSTNAQEFPLRVTLVWTDPPGNPNAAIKLVNDLDLVVSNTVSGEVYYGNDIRGESDFNHPSFPEEPAFSDLVNNVENVYIREPFSSNLVVTVRAKRVNVTSTPGFNLATGRTDDIVQDYALVISLGDTTLTNALTLSAATPLPDLPVQPVAMTNGLPLMNQRVGANSALANVRHGLTNQWNFFIFTNVYVTNDFSSITNGTNVAFLTFFPPNLARPRNESADIDLYVSKDPRLVDLEPTVVDAAWKSVTRSGTELVVFTNAAIGDIYYVGVKSEDQQGGEFGLIALSSDQPFDENRNGKRVLHGMPAPQVIPDGSPNNPGHTTIFAISVAPITVKKVTVTDVLTHQDVGDLSILLTHERNSVVLHNHSLNGGRFNVVNQPFVYQDQTLGTSAGFGIRHSDGPGSLTGFVGSQSTGAWLLNVVDSALSNTGRVESVTIELEPLANGNLKAAGAAGLSGTVDPNDTACYPVQVPAQATNLIVNLSQLSGSLVVYLRHGNVPETNIFDKSALISPPGGTITLGANDEPIPLQAGEMWVCVLNLNNTPVDFHIAALLELGVGLDYKRDLVGTNVLTIPDDGEVTSTVHVPVDKQVAEVEVAVRIDHPRASDLVLHLISPQGTRVLLAENRNSSSSSGGYGAGFGTNLSYSIFSEDTNLLQTLAPIKFSTPPWTNLTSATNPLTFSDGFEAALPGVYLTNQTLSVWTVSQGAATVHGASNSLGITAYAGTNYVELDSTNTPASIVTSFDSVPGKDYLLNFFYQRNPAVPLGLAHGLQVYYGPPADLRAPVKFIDVPSFGWESANFVFRATSAITQLEFGALTAAGPLLDSVTVSEVITTTNIYVMPEEPLSALQGQRALGDWTLEVQDTRLGPAGASRGTLIGWELQLQYGNPPGRATVATNGASFAGVVTGGQTNYFYTDVCDSATAAFAVLSGPYNRLNLLVSRLGFPTGDVGRDEFVPLPNDFPTDSALETGLATFALDTDPHQPAPLIPGGRLYFAVNNLDPGETNAFTFQASVDGPNCATNRAIIRLVNNVPYTNVVAPSASLFDYYVFDVSPTAVRAEFEVRPRTGDVGLVLSYGQPLPDLSKFDYKSDQPGTTNELIIVTNTSSPVSLQSGDWYIGVYNNSTTPVVYDVRASEVLDTNLNVVILTNTIPVDFTIQQNAKLTNFFLFKVPDLIPGLKFELSNLNGNADLFIGYNILPSPTSYLLSNSASPASPLTMEIRTNASLPTVKGNWLLQVVNRDPTNLFFTLRASFLTNTVPGTTTNRVFDPNITVSATNICFSWPATVGLQYSLQGAKSITDTNWAALFGPTVATNTLMTYCMSLPSEYSFFRVVETSAGTSPPPTPETIINPALTVTSNSVCLAWASRIGSTYQVQGLTALTNTVWTNIGALITATTTNSTYCVSLPSPYRFFQVVENPGGGTPPPPPTNAEILNPALSFGTNGLCLTWPSQAGLQYDVQAMLSVTNASWTNLFGPITATGPSTTHCLPITTPYHFFQIVTRASSGSGSGGGTNSVTLHAPAILADGRLQLVWDVQPGSSYDVQFTTNLLPIIQWTTLTNLTASSTTATVIDGRNVTNSVMRFYRILKR